MNLRILPVAALAVLFSCGHEVPDSFPDPKSGEPSVLAPPPSQDGLSPAPSHAVQSPPAGTKTGQRDPRFVGLWMVDQPYHALYEATFYTFHSDGHLEVGKSYYVGGHVYQGVTGSVSRGYQGPRCVFGKAWSSRDAAAIVIEGECSDGARRDIVLVFRNAPASNAAGADVVIESVGGESGWIHGFPEWRFVKCETEAKCPHW